MEVSIVLEERVKVARLLDIYGALLTERQQRILARYVLEDFSLGEIAENEGISRQAVHDTVKRGLSSMEEYEKALCLLDEERQRQEILQKVLGEITSVSKSVREQGIERLKRLIE